MTPENISNVLKILSVSDNPLEVFTYYLYIIRVIHPNMYYSIVVFGNCCRGITKFPILPQRELEKGLDYIELHVINNKNIYFGPLIGTARHFRKRKIAFGTTISDPNRMYDIGRGTCIA